MQSSQPQSPTAQVADPEAARGSKPKPTFLERLPTCISFWLGHRKPQNKPLLEEKRVEKQVIWFWSFLGSFASLALIQAMFGHVPYFVERGVPSIGATAILLYGAIESPLAQPRPVVGGHLVGAFVGVSITKLFLLLPTQQLFDELSWLSGSLCCAVALVVMQMTGTTHPPAGATALIATVSQDIREIGWLYIPVVLLASSIALVVALICNNMHGRYPTFWWTLPDTPHSVFPTLPLSLILEKLSTWRSTSQSLNCLKRSEKGGKEGVNNAQRPQHATKSERDEQGRNDEELAIKKQDIVLARDDQQKNGAPREQDSQGESNEARGDDSV